MMNFRKKWDIINTLVSAACAILCTVLAGCKLYCGEMSIKNLSAQISIPNNSALNSKEIN